MVENMINERKRYETAICFARMYGVRETLEPVQFQETENFVELVLQWADEYLKYHLDDMVSFFETKIMR